MPDRFYQFGLGPSAEVLEHLPFTPTVEDVRLGWTPISIAARLALAGGIAVLVLEATGRV